MKSRPIFIAAIVAAAVLCSVATPVPAQYRGQEPRDPSITEKIQAPSSSFLGLFSSDRFRMTHGISMSYLSYGGQGAGVAMYTNSMDMRIADPLHLSADVSYLFSPKGSSLFGGNELSAFILQRAQLDYRPAKDVLISLQYRQIPYDYLYNPLYGQYARSSLFFGSTTPSLYP